MSPIQRLTSPDVPIPYSEVLEREAIPGKEKIIKVVRSLLS